ncbi:MAG: DUF2157 domain-containing protein [Cyanobacteriota bacterium]|nr:DUF2157 domain-containing protein [Cyanobacteriota bacterium]
MADDRFRRQLAQVLDLWVSEDLIAPAHREKLRQYYQLDHLNRVAGGRFIQVVMILGSLLVGLGIISFVAANWAAIPPAVRAIVALLLVVGLQGTGFYLWRGTSPRLGTTLLLIGELALGGSIGLMAQWFQVSGALSGLFLAWGLGVLLLAVSLRHSPSGSLAVWLLLAAYISDFSVGLRENVLFHPGLVPWLVIGGVMPLAYWCRSRWIWVQSIILLMLALQTQVISLSNQSYWNLWQNSAYIFSMTHLIGLSGVWAWSLYHQRWLPWLYMRLRWQIPAEGEGIRDGELGLDFAPIAQGMALWGGLILLYGWSFWEAWAVGDSYYSSARFLIDYWRDPTVNFPMGAELISLLLLGIVVLALWIGNLRCLLRQYQQADPPQRRLMQSQVWMGVGLLTLLVCLQGGGLYGLSVIFINFALCGMGVSLMWQGLQLAQRWRFWLGLLTLTLAIITRFFEYDTGLLLKSLAFVTCGVGVIVAGINFERRLAALPTKALAKS